MNNAKMTGAFALEQNLLSTERNLLFNLELENLELL